MTPLSAFLPYVLPHAYGCPDPVAEQAIRDACIEFCGRSNLIQAVDVQSTLAGVADYAVSTPAQQNLSQVLAVTVGANQLRPVSISDVNHGAAMRAGVENVDAVVESARGTPGAYYQTTPTDTLIYLWPVPAVAEVNALAIRAAYVPTRAATDVEDVLFEDWANEIASGALARLLSMPAQVFTNPKFADAHEKRFGDAVASATSLGRRGQVPGATRVRANRFI